MIRRALAALRHWHEINGLLWNGPAPQVSRVRHAAELHVPDHSQPPRPPVTLEHLQALREGLSFLNTKDSAVYAVATAAFWGVGRLSELTVPSLSTFNPHYHVTRGTFILQKVLPNQGRSFLFRIPWSKTTKRWGADYILTRQPHGTCPIMAMEHHLIINNDIPSHHGLFSYAENSAPKFLTKAAFLTRCREIWSAAGLPDAQGYDANRRRNGAPQAWHVIGSTADARKIDSNAFKLYLRRLNEVLSTAITAADVH